MSENVENSASVSPLLYVLAAVILWSSGGLFFKLTTISAYEVNAGRCFLAALVIGLLTYKKGLRPDRFTILTALLYAGTLSCFAIANKKTVAANAIFLQYTAPIYILLLAPFLLKETFKFTDLFVIAVCLAGMTLFFFDAAPSTELSAASQFEGNIYALVSGVFFGVYFTLLRHPASLKKNPAISVFYGNLFAVLVMLPFFMMNPSPWTTGDVLAVSYLGIFQIGLAYFLFTYGIAQGVRSLDASIIGFIEPLLNPIWVVIFVGERPSNWAIAGGAVIIGAVIFHTLWQHRTRPSVAEI